MLFPKSANKKPVATEYVHLPNPSAGTRSAHSPSVPQHLTCMRLAINCCLQYAAAVLSAVAVASAGPQQASGAVTHLSPPAQGPPYSAQPSSSSSLLASSPACFWWMMPSGLASWANTLNLQSVHVAVEPLRGLAVSARISNNTLL